jgi:RNA polymerase sigma-70 factor (ECF subfamily)
MKEYVASDIVTWVSLNVLPHEAELRMKLSMVCKDAAEVDDVLQEVYCRLLKLESVEQIWEPRGYVMRMARNIAELKWVMGLIAGLPDRCRQVIRARRIHGLSQDATAETLGLSKSVVEKETMRGMALISESIEQAGIHYSVEHAKADSGKVLHRKRNV